MEKSINRTTMVVVRMMTFIPERALCRKGEPAHDLKHKQTTTTTTTTDQNKHQTLSKLLNR
eukprot:scaffold15802_cov54-Attheya_sp.AAC.2